MLGVVTLKKNIIKIMKKKNKIKQANFVITSSGLNFIHHLFYSIRKNEVFGPLSFESIAFTAT